MKYLKYGVLFPIILVATIIFVVALVKWPINFGGITQAANAQEIGEYTRTDFFPTFSVYRIVDRKYGNVCYVVSSRISCVPLK